MRNKVKIVRKPERSARRAQENSNRQKMPGAAWPQTVILAILLAAVAVCVVAAHFPALTAQASSFDDEQYLHKNSLVQNPSWGSAWRFLSEVLEPSTVGGYYQPLAMISLMLDYAMGGRSDNLLPFHITSLCLHVMNTLLIIVFLYVLFGSVWPAVIAGLLFGLHPMTVEPIPWVSERKTLLASFFALWSLIMYVRYARGGGKKFLIGCVVMYVLALMSKPTTVPLAVLLLLLDFWPLKRFGKAAILEKVPLFIIMVIFGFITVISQNRSAGWVTMPTEYDPVRIPLVLCHNIVFYLYKIIWPVNLTSHYPIPMPFEVNHPVVFGGVAGTVIFLSLLVISLRWTRALMTGWLFFFVGMLPTMGIIGFTNVLASDKYAYLPSVGLLMVLALFFEKMRGYVGGSVVRRVIAGAFIVILAGSEFAATHRYLYYWQDSERLYQYMLGLAPNSASVHLDIANIILKKGRREEAIKHYKIAIEHGRNLIEGYFNLGFAYFLEGRYEEAIEQYSTVLKMKESYGRIHYHIANALAKKGETEKAIEHYNKALERRPDDVEAYNNLALLLVQEGEVDEAIKNYNKSLEINSESVEVLNNLGNALAKQGRYEEAAGHLKKALSLDRGFAVTYYNLGNALSQMGRNDESAGYFREAVRLRPGDADAHYGLGLVLDRLEEYDEAVKNYERAIELKPDYAEAYYRLGVIFANRQEIDKALEQLEKVLRIYPEDAEMHCNVGILLVQKGRIDEAIEEFRTALRLAPGMTEAREELEALEASGAAGAIK